MKLAITALVGALAAVDWSVATDAVKTENQPHIALPKLSSFDATSSSYIDIQNREISSRNITVYNAAEGYTISTSPTSAHEDIVARDQVHGVSGYTVQMRWGGKFQHVGELAAADLRDHIKKYLDKQCPVYPGVGNGVCGDIRSDNSVEKIEKIGYDGGKHKWVEDAHLELKVKMAYWPQGHDGIREAFHETIADMFSVSIVQDENCSKKWLSGREIKYCQAPEWVMVSVDYRAWMIMHLNFNGKTDENLGSCVFAKDLLRDYVQMDKVKEKFGKAMHKVVWLKYSCWDENGVRKDNTGDNQWKD